MQPQVMFDPLPRLIIQAPRPTCSLPFPQSGEATLFETVNPALDRRGVLAKPLGDIVAAMALVHEQHSVEPVVIA